MIEKEFEETLEAVTNIMTSFHNRLLRIEEWMIKAEEYLSTKVGEHNEDVKEKDA